MGGYSSASPVNSKMVVMSLSFVSDMKRKAWSMLIRFFAKFEHSCTSETSATAYEMDGHFMDILSQNLQWGAVVKPISLHFFGN